MKPIEHVESGRAAKAAGDNFESWINQQHDKARHLGILAHIEKTEAHTRMVNGRLIYTEKGVADYVGCLDTYLGRYLALEAKSTKAARFSKNEISHKQRDHLDRAARAGGLSLLLMEFRQWEDDPQFQGSWRYRRFAVQWLDVPWQVKRSAESISADELAGWEVHPECYLKRWHLGGSPSTSVKVRNFPRE